MTQRQHRRLERMLEDHFEADAADACARAGQLDRYMAGDRSPEVMRALEAHTAECAICREARALFDDALADGLDLSLGAWHAAPRSSPESVRASPPGPTQSVRAPSPARRRAPPSWWWGLAASVTIAAGVAIVALSGEPDQALRAKGGAGANVTTSSAHDDLIVSLERDGLAVRVAQGTKLAEGDRLTFFHTSRAAGFVAVYNVDGDGMPTRLFPDAEGEGVIMAGAERALSAGAIVGPGRACEWLIAIFSDTSLDPDELERRLRSAARDERRCTLDVTVPGARTLVVLRFER